jgi:uncharacterized alkaline shock family protein YloU
MSITAVRDAEQSVVERGRTTVTASAVERIATALTSEFDGIGGTAPRLLTFAVGSEGFSRDAQVSAVVDGDTVTTTVRCSVSYPTPVASATEALRAHLIARIGELTGLRVRRVDITVTALHNDTGRRVR